MGQVYTHTIYIFYIDIYTQTHYTNIFMPIKIGRQIHKQTIKHGTNLRMTNTNPCLDGKNEKNKHIYTTQSHNKQNYNNKHIVDSTFWFAASFRSLTIRPFRYLPSKRVFNRRWLSFASLPSGGIISMLIMCAYIST